MRTKICTKCKRELPLTIEYFHRQKSNKTGFKPRCKECRNKKNREYKEKIREKNPKFCEICGKKLEDRKYKVCKGECRKTLTFLNRKRIRDNDQKLLSDYKLSRGCSICGYNKCPNALEFHHKYGKDFKMNSDMFTRRSEKGKERIKKELEKCILLCSNCHRETHYKEKGND